MLSWRGEAADDPPTVRQDIGGMPWQHMDGLCQHIKCFIFFESVPEDGGW